MMETSMIEAFGIGIYEYRFSASFLHRCSGHLYDPVKGVGCFAPVFRLLWFFFPEGELCDVLFCFWGGGVA